MPYLSEAKEKLHYDIAELTAPWVKEPETIIFHHGAGAISGIWAEWMPALADKYRLVRFDMRGMGLSAAAARKDAWTFETYAEDVVAVADAVGAKTFHFVGESYGGTVGLMLGLRHRRRVRTLTISNAAHVGSAIGNIAEWEKVLRQEGGAIWSKGMMRSRFYDGVLSPEKWAWYEAQQASHPIESIIAARQTLVDANLTDRLPSLDVPVLLLHGDASPFVSVALMADMKSRLPRAELQIFAHAKHGLPFSHAKECAAVLRAFLERQS
jgi:pimeloyl-ACP methyl ester carboxylesterase